MITIKFDDRQIMDALRGLLQRVDNLEPAMQEIGQHLVLSTKRRFGTSVGPDGVPWKPNSQVTYLRMIERARGVTLKSGRINKKGADMAVAKKPLIGETHRLSSEIYAIPGRTSVTVGSPMRYAATQQFGADQGAFGKTKRGGPIPWGDIPPRPFLGLDDQDKVHVLDIVHDFLDSAIK